MCLRSSNAPRMCAKLSADIIGGTPHSTTAQYVPPNKPSSWRNPFVSALSRNAANRALTSCRPEEMEKVGRLVIQPGTHTPNTKIVGRPATMIAEMAGIKVPPATRVLIARLEPSAGGERISSFGGEAVADPGVLCRGESCRGHCALPQAAGIWRAGACLRDSFPESCGDPGIWGSHARVSRGRQQFFGTRLDQLL